MKVITIRQPYASLIANGYKKYEFRNWKTNYRGDLYIHAGSSVDKAAMKKVRHLDLEYPKGRIIAKVNLKDCFLNAKELDSDYKYAFLLTNIVKVNYQKVIKGQLGIWNYKDQDLQVDNS